MSPPILNDMMHECALEKEINTPPPGAAITPQKPGCLLLLATRLYYLWRNKMGLHDDNERGMFEVSGPSLEECIRNKKEAQAKNDMDGVRKWEREEKSCREELSRLSARNKYLIESGWLTD